MFEHSKLKIKRANQHINELNTVINDFVKSDFYTLYAEKDPESTNSILKFKIISPIPEMIPCIIGDALHSLRSALDFMLCDIVRAAGETPGSWTKFPVRDNWQNIVGVFNEGVMKVVNTAIVDYIVNEIRPYDGANGNEALFAMHYLDIDDKHMNLIPAVTMQAIEGVSFTAGNFNFTDCGFTSTGRGEMYIVNAPGNLDVTFHNKGKGTFHILFGKGNFFSDKPVVPTLTQLSQQIFGFIVGIEAIASA